MSAQVPRFERRFQLFLIKPSHYDDDGYVIQWSVPRSRRTRWPASTALRLTPRSGKCLGEDVAIDITAIDETNTRIERQKDRVATSAATAASEWWGSSACSPTNFLARWTSPAPLREAGVPVVIGGFHVSGCLAMLPEMQPDLQEALDLGCSLFAGEAEKAASTNS